MARQFDPQKDNYYYPDHTPDLYLSEKQVTEALEQIAKYDDPAEKDARKFLVHIEGINRDEGMGIITKKESLEKNGKAAKDFANGHGFWPWETKTVKQFYESFKRNRHKKH